MLQQIQNNNPVNSDWTQRLFIRPKELNEHISLNTKSTSSSNSALLTGHRRQDHHWSKHLFACATIGLKPYDKLVVFRDKKILCEYKFRSNQSEVVIGSNCIADIVLEGSKVDQFHARVSCNNGKFQFEDLGSKNGSYLNGKKMIENQPMELKNGSSVCIMAFQIRFELREEQLVTNPSLKKLKINHDSDPNTSRIKPGLDNIDSAASTLLVTPQTTQRWQKGITELIVSDIIDETHDVKTFRLIGVTPLYFSYLAGQFITLLLNIDNKEVQRSYSMSSSPSRPHTLDLTVKRVPGGLVSNWLCDHIKLGNKLKVKGAVGRFSCLNKPTQKLLFIGAGSGITPLMSMSRWLFDTTSTVDTKVLFSFRNHKDIIFRKELEMMEYSAKAIDFAITLTGRHGTNKNWKRFSGRIDHVMLDSFVEDLNDRDIYLCGPEAFMDGVKSHLKTMNYPMQRLHCESFGNTQNHLETQPQLYESKTNTDKTPQITKEGTLHTVTFTKSKKVVQTDEKTNLLQLAEAEGIEIDSSCKSGHCAECMIKCLSGKAEMNDDCDIDDHEREQGWIFSCCTFARSDLVINA